MVKAFCDLISYAREMPDGSKATNLSINDTKTKVIEKFLLGIVLKLHH
jgi:hypothetical protein